MAVTITPTNVITKENGQPFDNTGQILALPTQERSYGNIYLVQNGTSIDKYFFKDDLTDSGLVIYSANEIADQASSYTLTLSDINSIVLMNSGSANNLTVPPNSSVAFPVGISVMISQKGTGQTTVVAGSGVTINSKGGALKLSAQYSGATLIKTGTNTWYLFGDITT